MELENKFEQDILNRAKQNKQTIVLPEARVSESVFAAGMYAAKHNIANIIFLVREQNELDRFGFVESGNVVVINTTTSKLAQEFWALIYEKRKHKGVTRQEAQQLIKQENYFATMLVEQNYADGLVVGAEYTTAEGLRPALELIKGKTSEQIISTYFIMVRKQAQQLPDSVYVLADCALNVNPNANALKYIVRDTVESAQNIAQIVPRVALLSYSSHGSAVGEEPAKMREVAAHMRKQLTNIVIDGELQLDAAIVPKIAAKKTPTSPILGAANVLIFPNLAAGNIGYKLMQRFGGFSAIGPICQGFAKPVNDVSRGANEKEILLTIAITCVQAVENKQ